MKKTGEMLQNLRIQRGATLSELSSALKINSKVLHALETGNADQLPKPPFVRGFIKSYVMHFKTDPEPYLREYHKEMGLSVVIVPTEEMLTPSEPMPSALSTSTIQKTERSAEKSNTSDKPDNEGPATSGKKTQENKALEIKKEPVKSDKSSSPSSENKDFSYSDFDAEEKQRDGWRVLIFSLVVVILTLVIYVAYRTIDRYQREARISEETERSLGEMAANAVQVPPAQMPIPESALSSVVGDSGSTAQDELKPQEPTSNIQGDSSSTDNSTKPGTSSVSGSEVATAAASPSTNSNSTPSAAVAPDAKPAEPASQGSGGPAPSQEGSLPATTPSETSSTATAEPPKPPQRVREVVLEALEDIVVEYDAGGKKGTLRLKKDQVHVLRFSKSATLKINDAGAVNVSVDGTDRGVPGEKGNPVVVRY